MPRTKAGYRLIADEIAKKIKSGELSPGARLPTTPELAEQYGVSAATVHHAVALLHDRALITSHQGKGIYVAPCA